MQLTQLVSDSYLTYRGKLSTVPVAGSEKYNRIVAIANRKQREWAQDSNIEWPSRYNQFAVGAVVPGTQVYTLDPSIIRPSDYVELYNPTTTQKQYVGLIMPAQISRYLKGAYISGNPSVLTFIQTLDSSYTGYNIILPCYTMVTDLVNPTDTVAVDNPQWLVYAVAAELARNDYAKEEQFGNLSGMANDLYQKMIDEAQGTSFGQPNGVVNIMPQTSALDYNNFTGYGVN